MRTKTASSSATPTVFVVEDDISYRRALGTLFASVGLHAKLFASASEFMAYKRTDAPGCLILDVRLPGIGGLDFQIELAKSNSKIPIIFITAHGDIAMSVRAMKAGAVEFLTKPVRDQDLLDAVQLALSRADMAHETERKIFQIRSKFDTLSPREQEVMGWVTSGLLNKQVACEMGVTEFTVKVHRRNVMRKMGSKSLAELVRIADMLGVRRTEP
jgi:FixJ family two-component response regulator